MPDMPKQRRIELSAGKKKEICLYKQQHSKATQNDIVAHFTKLWQITVGRSTVCDIIKHSEKWLKVEPKDENKTRECGSRFPELEEALFMWFTDVSVKGLPISDDMLIEKAKTFGEKLGVSDGFLYSKGWLDNFKKRHGIKKHVLDGESDSADMDILLGGGSHFKRNLPSIAQRISTIWMKQNYFSNYLPSALLP